MKYLFLVTILFIYFSSNINAQIFGGSSLLLDGEFDIVAVNDSPELTPLTSTITLEAWVKTDSSLMAQSIITKYNSFANQRSWKLEVRSNGAIRIGVYENLNTWRQTESDSALIKSGIWHHIATTFDISNQESHIYLDGEEVPAILVSGSANSISFILDSNIPVYIGAITLINGDTTRF